VVRDAMGCPFGPVGVSYVPANRSDGFAEPAHGRVAAVRVAVFSAVGARQISGKKQILFSGMNQRGCNRTISRPTALRAPRTPVHEARQSGHTGVDTANR
jgi:hypothetical protein